MLNCCFPSQPFTVLDLYPEVETELRVTILKAREVVSALEYRQSKVRCQGCGHVGVLKIYLATHGFPDDLPPKDLMEFLS